MKALILHASAGGGHRRAAMALAEAAGLQKLDVTVRDILDFVPPLFRTTYAGGYLKLVRSAPELWGYLYAQTDRRAQQPLERHIRSVFNKLNALSFYRYFKREKPDVVICTHFLPLELVATRRHPRSRDVSLHAVVTDFAAHSMWYCKGGHRYYVATEEAARQLIRNGQPADGILRTGIPVMAAFAETVPPAEAKAQLGFDPRLPIVLILSGGCGVGPTLKLLDACLADPPPCRVLVVAGDNRAIETRARQRAARASFPVAVYGYVNHIHQLMDAAELIVSKPGGLTSAEALAKGKPLLIVDPVPGQEQRNEEYLLENGCAVRLFDPEDAPWKIRELLSDSARLDRLAAGARRMARPSASADIIRAVREASAGAG